ncbi:hypothetical protein [Aurantimonas coralicida]|uniref:hypothetical protein n=1 Tax=Aurantimonas coralicida TaxID=182270 RepID=UPI001E34211F|nr:hypothetical protein [Aurantimonas coralicida]MCD1644226.1 hypothetical protein [Aurantimonas coralicida]
MYRAIAAALALFVAGVAALPAQAADLRYGEPAPLRAALVPTCDDADVLGQVEDQFEYGAPTMVGVKLEILEFSGMFEKAYFPQRAGEPLPAEPIERRYCQATALLSDHVSRTVYYVIEHPMGFAAAGEYLGGFSPVASWRAEGCVLGLDEWHVYGANCESLRRFPEEGRTGYGYVSK